MENKYSTFYLLLLCNAVPNCGSRGIELQELGTVIDYTGPLTYEVLKPLQNAKILLIKNSNITLWKRGANAAIPKLEIFIILDCFVDIDKVEVGNLLEGSPNIKEVRYIHNKQKIVRTDSVRTLKFDTYILRDMENFRIVPPSTFNETGLKHLELSTSGIEEMTDDAFSGLETLLTLDLHKNNIARVAKKVFEPLIKLQNLTLTHNMFDSFDISRDLPKMPELQMIDFNFNPIKALNLSGYEKVTPKLRIVKIAGAELTKQEINKLQKTTNITLQTDSIY